MSMTWDFILRLFVAGALGTVIGLDREYRAKEAGYRTHFLVSLGSALIMIVSQYGFMEVVKMEGIDLDPSRVAAQVVSGIGFIGAGTIIFQKHTFIIVFLGFYNHCNIIGRYFSQPLFVQLIGNNIVLLGIEFLGHTVQCFFIVCRELHHGTFHTYTFKKIAKCLKTNQRKDCC